MSNYLDKVKGIYADIVSAYNGGMNNAISICPIEIDGNNIGFPYELCHPILGNLLEFGWNRGEKTDTSAIRVALIYCAYAGMVKKHFDNTGATYTAEELFYEIAKTDGLFRWCENSKEIVGLNQNEQTAKLIECYAKECAHNLSEKLPQTVADRNSEYECLDACVAMYFWGNSISF